MIHSQALTEYQRQHDHYAAVKRRLWGKVKAQSREISAPTNDNVTEDVEPVIETPRKADRWEKRPARFDWHVVAYVIHRLNYATEIIDTGKRSFEEICYDVLVSYKGVTIRDLKSPSRARDLVLVRQMCMWLVKQKRTDRYGSYPSIGRWFGGRDHTTVLHACRKIDAMIQRGELEWLRRLAS